MQKGTVGASQAKNGCWNFVETKVRLKIEGIAMGLTGFIAIGGLGKDLDVLKCGREWNNRVQIVRPEGCSIWEGWAWIKENDKGSLGRRIEGDIRIVESMGIDRFEEVRKKGLARAYGSEEAISGEQRRWVLLGMLCGKRMDINSGRAVSAVGKVRGNIE